MHLAYLKYQDWEEFYRQHPGARAWLADRAVYRELENLESIECATPWMKERREELREWKAERDRMLREGAA